MGATRQKELYGSSGHSESTRRSTVRHSSREADTGWRLLKIRDLRWLWTGQAISRVGEGLNKVALLYLIYNLTNSTLMTTVIGVLQTLPPLILGPLIGVYVDRSSKKWIMMGMDVLRAGLALIIPLPPMLSPCRGVRRRHRWLRSAGQLIGSAHKRACSEWLRSLD